MTTWDDIAQPSWHWTGKVSEGALGHAGPYNRQQLAAMIMLLLGDEEGILSGLTVAQSSPAGKSVTVAAGRCVIKGILAVPNSEVLTIDDNASGNSRIDVIVAECDWTAQTITKVVVKGTPAASPSAPALTQTDGTLWQEPMAHVAVADGFTQILDANITDWRQVIDPKFDTGDFKPWGSDTIPDGWLLCYGQAVSRTRYADLFAVIGTQFGAGDGTTTFNIPELRGRKIAGKDNMGGSSANCITNAAADSLGGVMGEELHTQTAGEMHTHTHTLNNATSVARNAGTAVFELGTGDINTGLAEITVNNAGSSTPFNVMDPTMFMNIIVKW